MKSTIIKKEISSELRRKAEAKLKLGTTTEKKSRSDELDHELNVHKIELEMQNEELRSTQYRLEKSLISYADLFEFAPIGYFILDQYGVIEKVNDAGSILLGKWKTQLIGKPFSIFISTEFSQDEYYRSRNEIMGTEKLQQFECEIKRNDGTVFPALITSASVKDDKKNFKYFLSTISDISERKEQERKIKLALDREKELNELKSRFISTASHEFRTPLATILLSTELLEAYQSPEDEKNRKKHFSKIKSSVQALTEVLVDFLLVNKFEDGFVKNNPEPINLVAFIESVNEEINIKKYPVNYKHTGTCKEVFLDRKLLKVCVSNLLGNAIKYSQSGKDIKITTHIDQYQNCSISIQDRGIGIIESEQPFIFDQFFRGKNAEVIPGTGLGLNIVKKFITVMNGSISFSSKLGRGSTFVLQFPGS